MPQTHSCGSAVCYVLAIRFFDQTLFGWNQESLFHWFVSLYLDNVGLSVCLFYEFGLGLASPKCQIRILLPTSGAETFITVRADTLSDAPLSEYRGGRDGVRRGITTLAELQ